MTHRTWVFTINNPDGPLDTAQLPKFRYLVYQRESGKGGTEHYQGYIELTKPSRLAALKKAPALARAHLEGRKGTREQAREYCMKEDTRVDGPWEFGDWDKGGQGTRTDWQVLQEDVVKKMPLNELTEKHFGLMCRHGRGIIQASSYLRKPRSERTKVAIFYGPPGCGKTTLALSLYPKAYWKPARTKWFDGYNGEETVIMDEFTGSWFEFDLWKRLGDGSPLKVESKGGYLEFTSSLVVYISNFHPRQWYHKLFQTNPDQVRALSRRVDLLEIFKEDFTHEEIEDASDWINTSNFMLVESQDNSQF